MDPADPPIAASSRVLESARFVQVIGDFTQGGDGRVARNLAMAIREAGGNCRCIALRSPAGPETRHAESDEIGLGIRTPAAAVSGWWRLRRLLVEIDPDVVHVHGPSSLPFVASALLRRDCRLWFTWHDSGSLAAANRRSFRWSARRCHRLFGSSSDVARRFGEVLVDRPISVFRNGVPASGTTDGMGNRVPHVVWAARWVPPKDPLRMILALATLAKRGIAFRATLAGSGDHRYQWLTDQIRNATAEAGLLDVIEFPGWIADLPNFCSNAAIGVQTSVTEGLSMALLEQAMAGLAIVATDVGDTRAVIEHERTGLLIPPGDTPALTAALERLLTDEPLRRRLGDAARARVLEKHSLAAMASQAAREWSPQRDESP